MSKKSSLIVVVFLSCGLFAIAASAGNADKKYTKEELEEMLKVPSFEEMKESVDKFNKDMDGNKRYQHEKAGEKFLNQQKYSEAIREFDAALKLDPSIQTVHVKKGIALYRSRRPQEAVASFDKAIEYNKRGKVWLWYPLLHKGIALGMMGKSKDSIEALSASIVITPTAESYLWRAIAYGQLNQLDKASHDIQAGLKIQPRNKRLLAISAQLKQVKSTKAFLEQMSSKKGAQKTASGLIFFELKPGTGPSPKATNTVKVHYHGTLPNGTVFDSSVDRGKPIDFPLNRVIPCWTEGLQKMKVGGKSRLVCPSQIAYGNRKVGAHIQPGATLLFEVELLAIE